MFVKLPEERFTIVRGNVSENKQVLQRQFAVLLTSFGLKTLLWKNCLEK